MIREREREMDEDMTNNNQGRVRETTPPTTIGTHCQPPPSILQPLSFDFKGLERKGSLASFNKGAKLGHEIIQFKRTQFIFCLLRKETAASNFCCSHLASAFVQHVDDYIHIHGWRILFRETT